MITLSTSAWTDRLTSGQTLDIVALGDSWTLGNCADGWLEAEERGANPDLIPGSWASQLRRTLLAINPSMRWHNEGRSGWKSAEGLENYEGLVAAHSPALLILNFGINDWKNRVPLETFRRQLDEIIRRSVDKECACLIWTSGPVAVMAGNSCGWPRPVDNAEIPVPLSAFHHVLRQLAEEYQTIFVDVARELEDCIAGDGPEWMVDAMHLNQRGHDTIHQCLAASIFQELESKATVVGKGGVRK